MQLTDEELIAGYKSGDETAADILITRYKSYVQYRARSMFLIGGTTDDLIQEGMIGLFYAIRSYREAQQVPFANYAKLCITRKMYTAIEQSNRKKNSPLNSYVSLEEGPQAKSPEDLLIDQENMGILEEAIEASLSELEREVLELHIGGLDYKEIASRLDKTPKQIDNALQRIKNKLRKILF